MAYPGATLLEINENELTPTTFDEVEHVRLTADFLKEPNRYLRHLLEP
jgi:predicted ATPase